MMYGAVLIISFYQLQNYSNPWIKCTTDSIPLNAIRGGRDHGEESLYIGRAEHQGAQLPGKVCLWILARMSFLYYFFTLTFLYYLSKGER